ncbi:hypothetical protein BU25DRAFT_425783 [Macroventuria anomochaeta]|uniref:Uncharacterized protein n=1 Tax=Macroventuria anomochaeta TaxID=301207 RepID=A0ACB6RL18_9PLEO|nr:uncharacterized protein BU25DRAFT_425783 [Macroventuria anomochaeta]KAF2622397.1 hypothetical protein BU25DRAFT_425783 [Macroventuria anomochaeta]
MSSSIPPRTGPPDASINVTGDIFQSEVQVDEFGTVTRGEPLTACSPSATVDYSQRTNLATSGYTFEWIAASRRVHSRHHDIASSTTAGTRGGADHRNGNGTPKKRQLKKRPDKVDNVFASGPLQCLPAVRCSVCQRLAALIVKLIRRASEGNPDAQRELLWSPPALTDEDQPPIDEAAEANNWRDRINTLEVPESALQENSTPVLKFPIPENPVDIKNKRNHKKQWENLDATYSKDAIEKVNEVMANHLAGGGLGQVRRYWKCTNAHCDNVDNTCWVDLNPGEELPGRIEQHHELPGPIIMNWDREIICGTSTLEVPSQNIIRQIYGFKNREKRSSVKVSVYRSGLDQKIDRLVALVTVVATVQATSALNSTVGNGANRGLAGIEVQGLIQDAMGG